MGPEARIFRWVRPAGVTAVIGALAIAAYWLLFTAFMLYDDEGYVLVSLRDFSTHGGLYDRVYTQYGPFPYLLYDALHRLLGFEFTNTSGRWITAVTWLGTCGLSAALVARVTRSASWTAFTFAGVFAYLWVMINEPVHPGGLIALLVAAAAWFGAGAAERRHPVTFAVAQATITAALLLTKINVGAFLLAATLVWLALHTASARLARPLTWLAALAVALLPAVLMHSLFAEPWVRQFALLFVAATLAVILAAQPGLARMAGRRTWGWFAAVLVSALLAIVALAWLRGSTMRALFDGVVLDPLRHPGVYFFAMRWRIGSGVLALLSLAAAAGLMRTEHWRRPWLREAVAWARVVTFALFVCAPLQLIPTSMAGWGVSYGVTLSWLFVLPLDSARRGLAARTWVALLLVFQFLHAYPIAGSQMNWGTFLWVPLLALGLHDAAPVLLERLGDRGRSLRVAGTAVVAGVTLYMTGHFVQLGWTRYTTSEPLGPELHGAESLRMPDEITFAMRVMTENLRAHGDLLFSAPGLYSANLWTELPTPTLANATHWFTLLRPAQQQAIIDRLGAAERPVVLVQRPLLDYVVEGGFAHPGPLQGWIREHFAPAFAIYPYELWVRRGRTIAALSTAVVREPGASGAELVLTLPATRGSFERLEISDVAARGHPTATLDLRSTPISLAPLNQAGDPTGPAGEVTRWPLAVTQISRLTIAIAHDVAVTINPRTLLVLRAPDGTAVAELRVIGSRPAP
jgi:hypothetical protein